MKKNKNPSVLEVQIEILKQKHNELLSGKPTLILSTQYKLRLLATETDPYRFPDEEVKSMLMKNPDAFFNLNTKYFINFNSIAEFMETADKSYKFTVRHDRKKVRLMKIESFEQKLINYAEKQMRDIDIELTRKEATAYKEFEEEVSELEQQAKAEMEKSVAEEKQTSSHTKANPKGQGK